MKSREEIIQVLEEQLFLLNFTTVDEVDLDLKFGQVSALESCIDKHKKEWTLEQFKQHLEENKLKKLYGDYIDGFMKILEQNIKYMEGD
ncbi:hypothetical protein [Clostridioides difficile]|uniref:hypothetical protein n=1 Tax=Clostridioides difficile TaxID=1496 RepID=UPI001033B555|nr:hypothetical protein [Clostridioides difficile]MCO4288410.1 hypothetical protein [Clostridioides difficile]MDV9710590.1 hypothetical protein [Clostridioides difficile]MDX5761165.1 hypothetical protein [Clostridioides difficile]NMU18211.1 hypothetical protein [Clostridioides difficile]UUC40685.1 hypothetical protein NMZ80_12500 [Clostridioides difficile]